MIVIKLYCRLAVHLLYVYLFPTVLRKILIVYLSFSIFINDRTWLSLFKSTFVCYNSLFLYFPYILIYFNISERRRELSRSAVLAVPVRHSGRLRGSRHLKLSKAFVMNLFFYVHVHVNFHIFLSYRILIYFRSRPKLVCRLNSV